MAPVVALVAATHLGTRFRFVRSKATSDVNTRLNDWLTSEPIIGSAVEDSRSIRGEHGVVEMVYWQFAMKVYEENLRGVMITRRCIFYDEQILKQHYTAHVKPPPLAYILPPPFLNTMEPTDTLLMRDEVISTISAWGNDELIKSSVDDLVPISRESEVTSDSNLECDMPINTPLPTTDVRRENFDINSPLGEYVVDFLIENEDIANLPRHLVKQPFSHLVKNPSSTKRMFDEPLGDDSKPRSYDEFEDISSLDFPKSAPLNYEPLGNHDLVSRSLETSDLNLEELTAEIGIDDYIPTEIDDGYYASEGYILFLEHLLIEETFIDPTLASGGKTRVMETPSLGFHHMPLPRLAAYSPNEMMYCYYHPHLTLVQRIENNAKADNIALILHGLYLAHLAQGVSLSPYSAGLEFDSQHELVVVLLPHATWHHLSGPRGDPTRTWPPLTGGYDDNIGGCSSGGYLLRY
nr:hypothetical protein [Tanacetum cinerariifolium]GEW85735.1 hypothetical protein [Tanacetum cinerariifolium]